MKYEKSVDRFDYSKYESEPGWDSDCLSHREYWGIHKTKDGRTLIDVDRYKHTCEQIGITDWLPKQLLESKGKFFVPAKIKRDDYIINIFNDLLNAFKHDWEYEFKPIFNKIITPAEVYEKNRLGALMYTSCADDIDEIEIEAMMQSFKREPKYQQVIQSLYCQFISKLATETDRIMLIAMCKLGYKGKDYSFSSFAKFTDGLAGDNSGIMIENLDKYNAYNMLHKINNFLKHNTKSSYYDLKRYYPDNVRSIEKGTASIKYENGMFAGDWIIIKDGYIDDLISKLFKFFKSYCKQFVKENVEEADWNYDDYFEVAFNNLKNPRDYYGIY